MRKTTAKKSGVSVERAIADLFRDVRNKTLLLCTPLEIDDYGVQSMPDASPIKWHLAHTTWFFEQFILKTWIADYQSIEPRYERLFNSYYQTVGLPHQPKVRHLFTRPTLVEVARYRRWVDDQVEQLLAKQERSSALLAMVSLGLHHEQQHQELMLTDIKHAFFCNPLHPAYRSVTFKSTATPVADELRFIPNAGGLCTIGATEPGFTFDNERPQHRVWLEPFALANRLVTNAEYLAFVRTGGYRRPEYWLDDGWRVAQSEQWTKPLYWSDSLEGEFTLCGMMPLMPNAPVCHVSYYEADAFARWAGMRLPTEFEWEVAAEDAPLAGNFAENEAFHPAPSLPGATEKSSLTQLFGDVWEWTSSSYAAYPGFVASAGAIGEYNGKFMANRFVLRGGSCATPVEHIRVTYRNFFPPHVRWQFSGIRPAR